MKQRLEQFLSAENLSKAQFADSINVARAAISHIMAGRNNPSYEFIVNTMQAYPDLNIEWLLRGKGKMYKTERAESVDLFSAAVSTPLSSEPSFFTPAPAPSPVEEEETPEAPAAVETNVQEIKTVVSPSGKVKKIVLFYDDNTYQEFC